jgi:hypothetical protein
VSRAAFDCTLSTAVKITSTQVPGTATDTLTLTKERITAVQPHDKHTCGWSTAAPKSHVNNLAVKRRPTPCSGKPLPRASLHCALSANTRRVMVRICTFPTNNCHCPTTRSFESTSCQKPEPGLAEEITAPGRGDGCGMHCHQQMTLKTPSTSIGDHMSAQAASAAWRHKRAISAVQVACAMHDLPHDSRQCPTHIDVTGREYTRACCAGQHASTCAAGHVVIPTLAAAVTK